MAFVPPSRPAFSKRQNDQLGRRAEAWCRLFLRLKGYRILTQRHRGERGGSWGEIDILAHRGHVLAVIEVKARRNAASHDLIAPRQQRRLIQAARAWLSAHPQHAADTIRFDLMHVIHRPGLWPSIRHISNAWQEDV
ncbi:MAG: YraN family protein [Alphaproteobacteria bacterium]|nr:MAG: YraN family protein [Alphaproteobacteria bacterium]